MAEFLTTNGTSYNIENIIIEAKSKLVLVSPYLQISKTFYVRLKDASAKKVEIKIIFGKDELKPNERNSLAELPTVELYYFQNLHAKCYFNESKMVITSMNMYEFSEKNNREMGVLVDRTQDKEMFEKAVNETHSIIQSSEIIPLKKAERKFVNQQPIVIKSNLDKSKRKFAIPQRGYCLRCQNRIPFAMDRPYCRDCYSTWAQFENPEYKETFCHSCGEFETTTIIKPLCYECFKGVQSVF